MLYAFNKSLPPLTAEQIDKLQKLEGTLGRLIYFSEYRDNLHHYIYDFKAQAKLHSFDEMCVELYQRIIFVNNYVTNVKTKRSHVDKQEHELQHETKSHEKRPKVNTNFTP